MNGALYSVLDMMNAVATQDFFFLWGAVFKLATGPLVQDQ